MRSRKKALFFAGIIIILAMVVAVWAGEPYKWPKDGETNGWGYFVDLYAECGEHLGIAPMAWNPVTERWENLEGAPDPAYVQHNPDGSWRIDEARSAYRCYRGDQQDEYGARLCP